jgi:glucokinase
MGLSPLGSLSRNSGKTGKGVLINKQFMSLLGIDIGGTKIAFAVFSGEGAIISRETILIEGRKGDEVGAVITGTIEKLQVGMTAEGHRIDSVGISIPGIYRNKTGTVWAPNIPGWDDYPLLDKAKDAAVDIPVVIDNDRACSMLGEMWKGNAKGCRNAVFLAVGTGIGAGILVNGEILRGESDIAGATGWMALKTPFERKYSDCGCFEYYASGSGMVKVAMETAKEFNYYHGDLADINDEKLTAGDIFEAFENGDPVARRVVDQAIALWGMAVANFVSIFNPEKIILGGGIFGQAEKYLQQIKDEAARWAQPISFREVSVEVSVLKGDAGVYGAAYLALMNYGKNFIKNNNV